jgi:hypothetical protein
VNDVHTIISPFTVPSRKQYHSPSSNLSLRSPQHILTNLQTTNPTYPTTSPPLATHDSPNPNNSAQKHPRHIKMCLTSMLQQQIAARRSRRFAREAAKLARNDHQRLNENLLRIALMRPTSVNSLTGKQPAILATVKR